ncbi:MAG: hypothetical protein U5K37_04230 [Natrialbaceae archaeon]|nr:hypothetical protein [Natrialbaceae archaeon]
MARDSPVPNQPDERRPSPDSESSRLDRRSYLRLAGAGALALGSLGASASTAAGAEYDVIRANGQLIEIGDGETFENKLIDLTTGQGVTIYARNSTNWTIRNVGFKGYNEGPGFSLSVSDTGGGTESHRESLPR